MKPQEAAKRKQSTDNRNNKSGVSKEIIEKDPKIMA